MRRLFITLAIAIVVIVMFLAAAIVHVEPAVAMVGCWPNEAMLAIALASASVGCCLGVVTGLFAGGGGVDHHGRADRETHDG
jgi:membrane protein YqaA with SNARE-associated domain